MFWLVVKKDKEYSAIPRPKEAIKVSERIKDSESYFYLKLKLVEAVILHHSLLAKLEVNEICLE